MESNNSNSDTDSLPTGHNSFSNNYDVNHMKSNGNHLKTKGLNEMLSLNKSVGAFPNLDKWKGSELSVHSMMVTKEEMDNYVGTNTTINHEKANGKSNLLHCKNRHGSSVDCLSKPDANGKGNTNLKNDLKEFSKSNLKTTSKSSSNKTKITSSSSKKHANGTARLQLSEKLSSTDDDSKASPGGGGAEANGHQRKRRRSSVQQGLMLEVAKLHEASMNSESKNIRGTRNSKSYNRDSECKTPSPTVMLNDDVLNVSNTILCPNSPSLSRRSDTAESEISSLYHSSTIYPSSELHNGNGNFLHVLNGSKQKKFVRMSSLSVTPPQRSGSGLLSHGSKESLQRHEMYTALRRASTAAEDVYRTSLPYIPSSKAISECNLNSENPYANELYEPGLLCAPPQWGSFCGTAGVEEKDINDQTCRSNFGMVLSALCFVLFLWYLIMVYSRFINKALHLDALEGLMAPSTPITIQEVVINISVDDLTFTQPEIN